MSEIYSALNLSTVTVCTPHVFTFVADDASTTLSLRCLQDATRHFAIVDTVTLNAAAAVSGVSPWPAAPIWCGW